MKNSIPSCEHKIRLLRGAVTEYLDEGLANDLMNDLEIILKEEERAFADKAKIYGKLYKKLYNS